MMNRLFSSILVLALASCAAETRTTDGQASETASLDQSAEAPRATGELAAEELAEIADEPAKAAVDGDPSADATAQKVVKSEDEWRAQLSAEEFRITRRKGTERAFTGKYWNEKRQGTYVCICCDHELFSSDTKFTSGTGWPSFYEPIADGHVAEERDTTYGMIRTEVLCARCDAHLGHVFPDGPDPTGLRYCINSASLELREKL